MSVELSSLKFGLTCGGRRSVSEAAHQEGAVMYKRHTSYWSLIGLLLTLVQAMCLGACISWPTAQSDEDTRCVLGRIEVDCNNYRLR